MNPARTILEYQTAATNHSMKLTELRNNPPFLIFSILLFVFFITKIPVKENLGFTKFTSDNLERIFISAILICILIIIIDKLQIPHSYFSFIDRTAYIYYLPAIIYVFLATGGFNDIFLVSCSTFTSDKSLLYGLRALSGGLFEEILFRGVIFGILLNKCYDSKYGVLKSVIISSLIFGLAHIANIWTQPEASTKEVLIQVYAASCLGVMYCATYLKTRSIIVLAVLHCISNYFSNLGELAGLESIIDSASRDKTIAEVIASILLTAVIFGASLPMGLYILKQTAREEVKKFIDRS